MALSSPGELNITVLLDPWTAAVASVAAKRGDMQGTGTSDGEAPTRASPASTAEQQQQQPTRAAGHASSIASKFNLPQANVMHVLRTAYFGAARNAHKHIAAGSPARPVVQSMPAPETSNAESEHPGEGREAKRLKAAVGGDSATASRRGAAALKRLCNALGVLTQQEHLPAHNLSYAVASCRGWRVAMEDTYAAEVPLNGEYGVSMFALYDGHGGAEVARYSALHMGRAILEAPSARSAFAPEPVDPAAAVTAATAAAAAVGPGSRPATSIATGRPAAGGAAASGGGAAPRRGAATTAGADAPGPPTAGGDGTGAGGGGSGEGGGGGGSPPPPPRYAALREAFLSLDQQLADEAHARELMALANPGALTVPPEVYGRRTAGGPYLGPAAGSTASVALVGRRGITVAAVGDSRCILGSRAGGAVALTVDHKGSDAAERERVVQAGCWVSASGRVCGELDMSRALGDADMKQAAGLPPHLQAVTADPTVMHIRLEPAAPAPTAPMTTTPTGPRVAEEEEEEQGNAQAAASKSEARTGGAAASAGGGAAAGDGAAAGIDPWVGPGRGPGAGLAGAAGPASGMAGTSDVGRGGGGVGSYPGGDGGGAAGVEEGGGGGATGAAGGSGRDAGASGGGASGAGAGCYLLLASDGLWNVLDTETVHEFVMERLEAGLAAESICAQLCVEACVSERTAYDNVTVLLVQMHGARPVGEVLVATAGAAEATEAGAEGGA